jgi:ATP-dependent Clp protease ATP-binding subunit ClpA
VLRNGRGSGLGSGTVLERFDGTGTRAVVAAAEQARALGHAYIGTEHLLLGLLAHTETRPARALSALGVQFDGVRDRMVEIVGPSGASLGDEGHLPFTPRVKRVLEMAEAERERLGDDRVSDVHLLLAVVREGEGVAPQLLRDLGVGPAEVERALTELP